MLEFTAIAAQRGASELVGGDRKAVAAAVDGYAARGARRKALVGLPPTKLSPSSSISALPEASERRRPRCGDEANGRKRRGLCVSLSTPLIRNRRATGAELAF